MLFSEVAESAESEADENSLEKAKKKKKKKEKKSKKDKKEKKSKKDKKKKKSKKVWDILIEFFNFLFSVFCFSVIPLHLVLLKNKVSWLSFFFLLLVHQITGVFVTSSSVIITHTNSHSSLSLHIQ